MEDLSLHILDIAENSLAAGANRIEINIRESDDLLVLEVRDNGGGMDEEILKMVSDPFFTTKTVRKVGLGIPLLKQAAEECGGELTIHSEKGKGTIITAKFKRSHIDLKPMGDIGATIMVLIASNPDIDIVLEYNNEGQIYRFDTKKLRANIEGMPINLPTILSIVKEEINKGIRNIKGGGK